MTTQSILSKSSERYLNREVSWLEFNARVLAEAENSANPLLERLNFLAISASNLDEFYMVRVAGLYDYVLENEVVRSIDGLNPKEEIALINKRTGALVTRQQECWLKLREELKKEDICIHETKELNRKDIEWLTEYFLTNIFPVLTPIAIDPAHPFPFLPNLSLALVLKMAASAGTELTAVVPLPAALSRFIRLPGKKLRFLLLEDVIEMFLDALYPDYKKLDSAIFRLVRDSELDVADEADDFIRTFERAVKQRQRGRVIRVRFMAPASPALKNFVREQLGVPEEEVIEMPGIIGLRNLRELVEQGPDKLKFPAFTQRFPERIDDFEGDCFAAIAHKDIVVHHPFESFDVVVRFLEQAAADPNVVSIKQTLYRTSTYSPIVNALIRAAENGKSVTALVELKARFDEETNIRFARAMERAGVHVVYGFVKLKTHAKVSLVTRKEGGKLVSYAHFGTGNYHPSTARLYTDLSFFTCDSKFCRDAAYLFNFVTGYAPPRAFKKLVVAPRDMRRKLVSLIEEEIAHVKAGRPGNIWAKMNALVDPQVIDALYAASNAGVQVDLVVRGICCLRPGVPGLSENIRVKSIIGRFLEHSRIYCFGGGHTMPSPSAKVFIGSADWMPRNLDWRVEIMIPIENPTVHEQILGQIMVANLKDEKNSWLMQPDGSYMHRAISAQAISAHQFFMENPSLSGRGSALKKMKSAATKEAVGKYHPAKKSGKSAK